MHIKSIFLYSANRVTLGPALKEVWHWSIAPVSFYVYKYTRAQFGVSASFLIISK